MIAARLVFISTLVLGGFHSPVAAEAQEAAKVARIGYLGTNLAAGLHLQEAFLHRPFQGSAAPLSSGSQVPPTNACTRTSSRKQS